VKFDATDLFDAKHSRRVDVVIRIVVDVVIRTVADATKADKPAKINKSLTIANACYKITEQFKKGRTFACLICCSVCRKSLSQEVLFLNKKANNVLLFLNKFVM
jgi:hypothetical protein